MMAVGLGRVGTPMYRVKLACLHVLEVAARAENVAIHGEWLERRTILERGWPHLFPADRDDTGPLVSADRDDTGPLVSVDDDDPRWVFRQTYMRIDRDSSVALRWLRKHKMVESRRASDAHGGDKLTLEWKITDKGLRWIWDDRERFNESVRATIDAL